MVKTKSGKHFTLVNRPWSALFVTASLIPLNSVSICVVIPYYSVHLYAGFAVE